MANKAQTNIEMFQNAINVISLARKYTEWKICKFGICEELQEELDKINNLKEFLDSDNWEITE